MDIIKQTILDLGTDTTNIRQSIENISTELYDILGGKEETKQDSIEEIINFYEKKGLNFKMLISYLEERGLPIEASTFHIDDKEYLTIFNEVEEVIITKPDKHNGSILCRNINSMSPSLHQIISQNKKSINKSVKGFFSTILPVITEKIIPFPEEEQIIIIDYIFFVLATIDYRYNIEKKAIPLISNIGVGINLEDVEMFFQKEFPKEPSEDYARAISWGHKDSITRNLKKKGVKKLIKKADKATDFDLVKLTDVELSIEKKFCSIGNILFLLKNNSLVSGENIDSINLKELSIYQYCLPLILSLKTTKDLSEELNLSNYDKNIEISFDKLEKNIIKENQYIFLLSFVTEFIQKYPNPIIQIEKVRDKINEKILFYLIESEKYILEIDKLLKNYILDIYNIDSKILMKNGELDNSVLLPISTINKAIEKSNIKDNKINIVTYYLGLNKEKQDLMIKLIKQNTFLIVNYFDLVKYIFNKSVDISIKEKILMKLDISNIEESSAILFSCVEKEKLLFISTIFVSYWGKVSNLSLGNIQKIKYVKESLDFFNINVRITEIIDHLYESKMFVTVLKIMDNVSKNKNYIFDEELTEIKKINLDTDLYLSYINKEQAPYIKDILYKLQGISTIIENRKKLGLLIIKHKKFPYIKEQFGESKLYNINIDTIIYILSQEEINIDFILYLFMKYGIKNSNKLSLKQLETIIENKDELEILDDEEIGDYINNIINEDTIENIENKQEQMIYKILELCENGNAELDIDIDMDHLYTKSKKWLYLCINILKKIANIEKTNVVTMLILYDYKQLKNILKIYEILDGFGKEYEFYQLFMYDNLGKEQFIDDKMINNLIKQIDKLSLRKIITGTDFIQDLIDFLTFKKDIDFILKKYGKSAKEKDIFTINNGGNNKTESIINQLIAGNLVNIRLKGIVKSQHKIVDAVKQIQNLDFSRLDIKKIIIKNGFYRLKIDNIRIIFRKNKGKIYFIKIGNRENFYSNINI